jgi:hypothetical protein
MSLSPPIDSEALRMTSRPHHELHLLCKAQLREVAEGGRHG